MNANPNELPELTDIQDDKTMSVNTEDVHINDDLNISPQETKEDINMFGVMKNVNIDKIKSSRCRLKGSKKPFWNFSFNQSKNNGKKRKCETERDVHKMIKPMTKQRKLQ